jgi:tRNA A-37 threonylcarbamoyl transferase component Bud32
VSVPDGFVAVEGVRAHGFARPEAADWANRALVRWGSLARAGARDPEALTLTGRGTVYAVPAPAGGRWVVRRYHRGGWMAPLLGDRYLRHGTARPLTETLASEAARSRGIPTPRIVAGMLYPAGPVYRADLVSEWIPDTVDLAAYLFGDDPDPRPGRRRHAPAALTAAGELIHELAAAGIRHRDLNAKNLLVAPDAGGPRLHVLDLDRATVDEPGGATAMGARLVRSLRKFEGRTGRPLEPEAWRALTASLEAGVDRT